MLTVGENTWTKGDMIRVQDEEGVFRFHDHVTNSKGEDWVDCYGPCVNEKGIWKNNGEYHAFNTDRILPINAKVTIKGKVRAVPKSKEAQTCLCGCGGQTKGGRFVPGHDARLKGRIVTQWREAKTTAEKDKARKALVAINPDWEKYLVERKAPTPKPKAEKPAKAAAKTTKAPAKAAGSTKKAAKKAPAKV
jgi:hypothetical protein